MRGLICGTCGDSFRGEQDPGHDEGYGDCPPCKKWLEEHNEERWRDLEKQVLKSFKKDSNREKFLRLSVGERRGMMLQMMEQGVITWKIQPGG